jgi:hypothetical protein
MKKKNTVKSAVSKNHAEVEAKRWKECWTQHLEITNDVSKRLAQLDTIKAYLTLYKPDFVDAMDAALTAYETRNTRDKLATLAWGPEKSEPGPPPEKLIKIIDDAIEGPRMHIPKDKIRDWFTTSCKTSRTENAGFGAESEPEETKERDEAALLREGLCCSRAKSPADRACKTLTRAVYDAAYVGERIPLCVWCQHLDSCHLVERAGWSPDTVDVGHPSYTLGNLTDSGKREVELVALHKERHVLVGRKRSGTITPSEIERMCDVLERIDALEQEEAEEAQTRARANSPHAFVCKIHGVFSAAVGSDSKGPIMCLHVPGPEGAFYFDRSEICGRPSDPVNR